MNNPNDISYIRSGKNFKSENDITQNNGVYEIFYHFLTNKNELSASSGYDVIGNSDAELSIEYEEFSPIDFSQTVSPQETAFLYMFANNVTPYSVLFTDVLSNIQFQQGTASTAQINIGQVAWDSNGNGTDDDKGTIAITKNWYNKLDEGSPANLEYSYSLNYTSSEVHGDIWLNSEAKGGWGNANPGDLKFFTILHELGHAMGLKGDFNPNDNIPVDNQKYTVMSYHTLTGMGVDNGEFTFRPSGLQLMDIKALQEIYETRNYTTRSDATLYSKSAMATTGAPNDAFIYTIWDGGGIDEISAEGFYESGLGVNAISGAEIDLRQGAFSSIGSTYTTENAVDNVAIAFHTIIENATGSDKNDTIVGNAWNNELIGGDGNDTLYGDGVVFNGDAGFHDADTLASSSATPWGTNGVAPDSNDSGNDILRGGDGDDTINAGLGDNEVYGGDDNDTITIADGASGTYDGGADNDTFIVKEAGNYDPSVLTLIGGAGTGDTITFEGGQYGIYIADNRDTDHVKLSAFDGSFHYELDGFEEIHVTSGRVLANVNANYNLTAGSTSAPTYDYSFVNGAVTNTVFDIGIYTGVDNQGSDWSFHRIVDVAIDINGVDHDGRLLDNTLTGTDTNSLHSQLSSRLVGSFIGTNNGDTINVQNVDIWGASTPASSGVLNFTLGLGDDIVKVDDLDANNFTFTYKGGNDTIRYGDVDYDFTGSTVKINIAFSYADSNVTRNASGGVEISTSKGVLTIIDMNPEIRFSSGEVVTIDAAGVETVTPAILNHTTYFYGEWAKDIYTAPDDANTIYYTLGGNDVIKAGGGDDIIYGYSGGNQLSGGAGDDQLFGGVDNDRIEGGADNDTISGGFGDDLIFVGRGSDTVTGGTGSDRIIVEKNASGAVTITDFDFNNDVLDLTNVSDFASYQEIVFYGYGNDLIGFDVEAGNFQIRFENVNSANLTESNFTFNTGGVFNNQLPLVLGTVQTGTSIGETLTAVNFDGEVLYGLGGDDELFGASGDDYIYGGNGDDLYLSGGGGNDVLVGGAGNDDLDGGTGDDYYLVDVDADTGFDGIFDMGGTDTLVLEGSITTSDIGFSQWGDSLTIENVNYTTAWEGAEIYDYFAAPYFAGEEYKIEYIVVQDVVYDLEDVYNTGTWTPFANWGEVTITFPDVPSITQTGSSISETLSSAAGLVGEALYGLGGADQLIGNEGDDYLYGGAGNDTLYGGDGDDSYIVDVDTDTGTDFDLIRENSGTDALFLNGVIYTSDISFSRYGDTLRIASSTDWHGVDIRDYFYDAYYEEDDFKVEYIVIQDVIYNLDDVYNTGTWTPQGTVNIQPTVPLPLIPSTTQTGSSVSETLTAVSVDGEILYGLGGNDWLIGNQGDDYLYGGDGDDSFIHGGSGSDVLVGGAGNDRLEGGSGSDFYIVDADTDTGFDTIWEYSGTDTLILNGNITTSDISFSSAGNTLLINSTTAWQGVNILDFFASDDRKVEYIVVQDTVYDLNDVYTTGIWTEFGGGAGDAGATGNAPNAFDDFITIDRGGTFTGNVLANNGNGVDYDTDGLFLEVVPLSQTGAFGTLDVTSDGDITIVAPENYVGTHIFSYTLRDFDGNESQATVQLDFIVTNEAPVAQNMDSVVAIQAGSALNFVSRFYDPDNDAITYSTTLQNGSALPSYITVDPATGALTGTMPTTSQATIGVRLIAADWMSQTVYDFDLDVYDTITGTAALDYLHGDAGVDIIYGGDGEDRLYGNDGDDVLHGDNDNDRIYGHLGNDTIYGDSGWDLLYGLQGDDTIFGGIGNDTIRGDDASGLDGYVGAGNDELHGGDGGDNISGGAGDDLLYGDAGNDYIYGNAGNDTAFGGDNDDRLYGNAGDDELHGDAGLDRIYGHEGNDVLYGDAGNDQLYGLEGDDILYGGEGADRLIGDDDPATAGFVGAGNDVLLGEGGNDVLGGGAGDDRNRPVNPLFFSPPIMRKQLINIAGTLSG
jgi:Ca2+-binding RTX toxin-like protein